MTTEIPDQILEDEDDTEMSLSDIYNQLLIHKELILTIPASQEDTLRKGLASVKSKQNIKLKDAGILPDQSVLNYTVTPAPEVSPDAIAIKITLSKRIAVNVLKIEKPDDF